MEMELATLQKVYDVVVEFIINYSFQILGALIILVIGAKLASWFGRLIENLLVKKNVDVTLSHFLGNMVKALVLAFVFIMAIGKFGISIAPFIAALGAVAFGSSLAIQGPLSNYGAGLTIILSRPFVVGNTIMVKGVSGIVEEIRLSSTVLTTEDGEMITIPNKHIVGEILQNSFENKIVETCVGISYGDDPQKAIAVVEEVLQGIPEVRQDPGPQIGIEQFADSSINIGIRYWIPTRRYFELLYLVNLQIHQRFQQAGINIPFPQRDVHLVQQTAGSA